MGKTKKFDLNVIEEGFDDKTLEEYELERNKIKEQIKEENINLNILTWRNLIILIIWAAIYKLFIKWQFVIFLFQFLCLFLLIWEKENPGNYQHTPFLIRMGTMTVNDLQSGMGLHSSNRTREFDDNDSEDEDHSNSKEKKKTEYHTKAEIRKREIKEKAQQPLNSTCICGSNKKYKNCCIKKNI